MSEETVSLILRVEDAEPVGNYVVSLHRAFADEDGPALTSAAVAWTLRNPVSQEVIAAELLHQNFLGGADDAYLQWIGTELHKFLYPDVIKEKQVELTGGKALRVYLDFQSEGLRFLPWEVIFAKDHLAFSQNERLLRVSPSKSHPMDPPEWPLRILIITGAESNSEAVAAAPEVEAIEDALWKESHNVHLEHCSGKTQKDLEDALAAVQPHIVHIIGHGDLDPITNSPGVRISRQLVWTTTHIRSFFSSQTRQWRPRLVLLNICRSAAGETWDDEDQKRSWSLERGFLELGVPGVIAMQGNVRPVAAKAFSSCFYEALVAGKGIDEAFVKGRNAIRTEPKTATDRRQAFLPRFHCGLPPETVLSFEPSPLSFEVTGSDSFMIKSPTTSDLNKTLPLSLLFVDREVMRRKLLSKHFPLEGDAPRLYAVYGAAKSGKKWAVKWILRALASRKQQVRWVDVVGENPVDWLNLLRTIRDNDSANYPNCIARQPLPMQAFRQFNWDEQEYLRNPYQAPGHIPADWTGRPDPSVRGAAPKELGIDEMKLLFGSFVDALATVSETHHTTVVLSNLVRGSAALELKNFEYFCRYFLASIGERLKNLTVMIILPPGDRDYRDKLSMFSGMKWYQEIEFDMIPKEDFSRITREYLRRDAQCWEDPGVCKSLEVFFTKAIEKLDSKGWPIGRLQKMKELYNAIESWEKDS